MAKKIAKKTQSIKTELSSWNFIIFLTLALMLIVFVLVSLGNVTQDLRSRAGLACPKVSLPDPTGCSGKWTYTTDARGCGTFVCEMR